MYTKITGNVEKYGYPYNYAEFICDTANDFDVLKNNTQIMKNGLVLVRDYSAFKRNSPSSVAFGSKAVLMDTKDVYILSGAGEWKFIKNANIGGGGGGTSCSCESATDAEVQQYISDNSLI